MFALEWWNYLIMGGVVFGCSYASYLVINFHDARRTRRADKREDTDHGPYPCLKHMGTDGYGMELWCWFQEGHEQPHDDLFSSPEEPVQGDALYLCPRSSDCVMEEDHAGDCVLVYGDPVQAWVPKYCIDTPEKPVRTSDR